MVVAVSQCSTLCGGKSCLTWVHTSSGWFLVIEEPWASVKASEVYKGWFLAAFIRKPCGLQFLCQIPNCSFVFLWFDNFFFRWSKNLFFCQIEEPWASVKASEVYKGWVLAAFTRKTLWSSVCSLIMISWLLPYFWSHHFYSPIRGS